MRLKIGESYDGLAHQFCSGFMVHPMVVSLPNDLPVVGPYPGESEHRAPRIEPVTAVARITGGNGQRRKFAEIGARAGEKEEVTGHGLPVRAGSVPWLSV